MKPPRTRDPDAKSTALRAAALRLFAERGYEPVSIADIASEAGMAVGTVYRFYPNKRAVLAAMHRELEVVFVERLRRDWDAPVERGEYHTRLRSVCHGLFDLIDERRAGLRVLSMTTDIAFENGALPGDAVRAEIERMYAQAVEAGAFRDGDVGLMASMAHGTVEGAMRTWLRSGEPAKAVVAEAVWTMLIRGVAAGD